MQVERVELTRVLLAAPRADAREADDLAVELGDERRAPRLRLAREPFVPHPLARLDVEPRDRLVRHQAPVRGAPRLELDPPDRLGVLDGRRAHVHAGDSTAGG